MSADRAPWARASAVDAAADDLDDEAPDAGAVIAPGSPIVAGQDGTWEPVPLEPAVYAIRTVERPSLRGPPAISHCGWAVACDEKHEEHFGQGRLIAEPIETSNSSETSVEASAADFVPAVAFVSRSHSLRAPPAAAI